MPIRHGRRALTKQLLYGPAWVDLQCNGFAGVDFNHPQTTPEQIVGATEQLWASGCGMVLPTIITHSAERMEYLLRVLVAARRLDSEVARSIPGFHLEGPFINPTDGARGAHPAAHVCNPNVKLWNRLQRAAEGLIRIVTLAPEMPGGLGLTRRLRAENVLVAIGHTLADERQVAAAADAGATLSTHLGNGCPPQVHRHHNPILAQLAEDRLTAAFIADGHHLPAGVLRTFVRAKPDHKSVIVTDAMAAAGAPDGIYTLGDASYRIGQDRVVRDPKTTLFAGSAVTMPQAVANYAQFTRCALHKAWTAASTAPASLLGIPIKHTVIVDDDEGSLSPIQLRRGAQAIWSNG